MSVQPPAAPHRVAIADIDIPFWRMVAIMMKWTFAAIPAVIIISIIFAIDRRDRGAARCARRCSGISIPEREDVAQPFSTRPATASSFFNSSGSRASGAVISALSSARSEPIGHGSCSRGKSFASRATSRFAFSALAVSTLMMSCTVTASWSGCQQSKSVTIATVA